MTEVMLSLNWRRDYHEHLYRHFSQIMNPNDFAEPLTSPKAPPACPICHLSCEISQSAGTETAPK